MSEVHKIRVNWTVNAPMMLGLLVQASVLVWMVAVWKTSMESQIEVINGRIALMERQAGNNSLLIERVTSLEANVGAVKEQTQRMEHKLDRVIERGGP